jgi:hypothetical protein
MSRSLDHSGRMRSSRFSALFLIDGKVHPALPPSYPPMDWVVPIPCCSLFVLYVGTTPRLVSGWNSTGAILSHYFLYLLPMEIEYFKFEKLDCFSWTRKLCSKYFLLVWHYKSQLRLGVLYQNPKTIMCDMLDIQNIWGVIFYQLLTIRCDIENSNNIACDISKDSCS